MRRELLALLAGAAAMMSACSPSANGAAGGESSSWEVEGDHAIGDPNAPVVMIEYASVMCGHCEQFHLNTFPEIQETYIDTGLVRYVFRELPTAPEQLAMAGFLMASCVPEDQYLDVIDVLFRQRIALFEAARAGGQRDAYMRLARSAGLTEEQYLACLQDDEEIGRIYEVADNGGEQWDINSTPSFVINGEVHAGARPIEDFHEFFAPFLEGVEGYVPPAVEDAATGEDDETDGTEAEH